MITGEIVVGVMAIVVVITLDVAFIMIMTISSTPMARPISALRSVAAVTLRDALAVCVPLDATA
jgi:hypothetical protein